MHVVVDRLGDVCRNRFACIQSLVQPDAAQVDRVGVVRIDANLTEIHWPGVRVVHLLTRRSVVFGPIEAGGIVGIEGTSAASSKTATAATCLSATACRTWTLFAGTLRSAASSTGGDGPLDRRVQNVRTFPRDVQTDSSQRAFGKAALQPVPR